MYVRRNLTLPFVLRTTWPSLIWTTLYATAALILFFYANLKWLDVPFELVSAVGIAVAFFIGFKNNQAYDRFWEGRKIWGSIVNISRGWANQVLTLVGNGAATGDAAAGPGSAVDDARRELIHRHLAWINALRIQLRRPAPGAARDNALVERYLARHREPDDLAATIAPFLNAEDARDLEGRRNVATHIVKLQGRQVAALRRDGAIDGFQQMMMMDMLEKAYDLQGMCERIKTTPFPRQFAYFSHVFTIVFCLLLPLGLLDVYEQEIVGGVAYANTFDTGYVAPAATFGMMVPLSVLVSWVFLTWEKIGDTSEDPFEGRPHDVSMTALCRTIEIDLRDMLDEADLPERARPVDHILY